MKHLKLSMLMILLAGGLVLACSEQDGPITAADEYSTEFQKVTVDEYTFDAVLDDEAPYEDCATGAEMQNHGTVCVHVREITTPSNQTIVSAWVDYQAYGGVTLENLDTHEIWTLTSGHNPFGEVIKENGFYMLHYQWNELYKNAGNATLHIHLKGHFTIDKDGNCTIDRESYTCR